MIEKKDGVDELFSLKGSNVITPFFDNFTRVSNFFLVYSNSVPRWALEVKYDKG